MMVAMMVEVLVQMVNLTVAMDSVYQAPTIAMDPQNSVMQVGAQTVLMVQMKA